MMKPFSNGCRLSTTAPPNAGSTGFTMGTQVEPSMITGAGRGGKARKAAINRSYENRRVWQQFATPPIVFRRFMLVTVTLRQYRTIMTQLSEIAFEKSPHGVFNRAEVACWIDGSPQRQFSLVK